MYPQSFVNKEEKILEVNSNAFDVPKPAYMDTYFFCSKNYNVIDIFLLIN
ncbi:hypothetical protein SAMN05216167_13820 [Spirosoma endophyticum]|uniref:Uncharacterized protein n=1 Tax=Spirosoma endophyticum TaxID=662367 RepID=A0A1I2H5L2_9BACT|nr:hypothetical protein SAMN05216167_13820 [Spirosoma endophyticum]